MGEHRHKLRLKGCRQKKGKVHATTPKVNGSSFLVTIPWPLHMRNVVQNSL